MCSALAPPCSRLHKKIYSTVSTRKALRKYCIHRIQIIRFLVVSRTQKRIWTRTETDSFETIHIGTYVFVDFVQCMSDVARANVAALIITTIFRIDRIWFSFFVLTSWIVLELKKKIFFFDWNNNNYFKCSNYRWSFSKKKKNVLYLCSNLNCLV